METTIEKVKDWRFALPLVEALYELSCVGGGAHIVIDDGNLEDANIDFCLKWCQDPTNEWDAETNQAAINLLVAMQQMSMTQRRKLYRARP